MGEGWINEWMNETSFKAQGFKAPWQCCGWGRILKTHVMQRAACCTSMDENNPFYAAQTMDVKGIHLQSQDQSSFFLHCVFQCRLSVLFYFPWRLNFCFFFIYKDVLKSHLEALKIFLPAANYRYIKSTHLTNENDWYTSKKLICIR